MKRTRYLKNVSGENCGIAALRCSPTVGLCSPDPIGHPLSSQALLYSCWCSLRRCFRRLLLPVLAAYVEILFPEAGLRPCSWLVLLAKATSFQWSHSLAKLASFSLIRKNLKEKRNVLNASS